LYKLGQFAIGDVFSGCELEVVADGSKEGCLVDKEEVA
jgi:hypothetical protein